MKLQIVSTPGGWRVIKHKKTLGWPTLCALSKGGPLFLARDRYDLAHQAAPVQWASRHFLTHEVSTKGVKHENTSAQRCRAVA
jgi:hypothetical protein